jgi:hypothetical protein
MWPPWVLTGALAEFQTGLGVLATGTVDAATIAAFDDALANAQQTRSAVRRHRRRVADPVEGGVVGKDS